MNRRGFLRVLGIGAAAPVAAKVAAAAGVEDAVKAVVADIVGVPGKEIITELSGANGVIRLSEALSVNVSYDNGLLEQPTIGSMHVTPRLGRFNVTMGGRFLVGHEFFNMMQGGEAVTVINDNPKLIGALPAQFQAIPSAANVASSAELPAVVDIEMVIV